MTHKVLYSLLAVLIMVVMLISAIDVTSFNREFYAEQYQKLEIAQTIDMSKDELDVVTDKLLSYIQKNTEDLHMVAVINGAPRQVFNEKEIAHMVDVQQLYLNALLIRDLSFMGVIIIALCLFLKDSLNHFKAFVKSYYQVLTVMGAIVLALALMVWLDFDHIWRVFHQIFFSNELWLLDPKTDILIMMVPLEFFLSLVIKIAFNFLLGVLLFTGCLHLIIKRGEIL